MKTYLRQTSLFIAIALLFLSQKSDLLEAAEDWDSQSRASEASSCKAYTEQKLKSVISIRDPLSLMGAGITALVVNPTSTTGKELLQLGSSTESPKKVATVSFIVNQLNANLPLKPLKENIEQLLKDDKDNALPYYAYALIQNEEGAKHKALALIQRGNTKIFTGYPKERFYAIVSAGEMAKCSLMDARSNAIWNAHNAALYRQLRQLCPKLIESYGQEAKDVCLAMGKKLEQSSMTMIEGLFSLTIQQLSLDDLPANAEARSQIKARRAAITALVGLNCDIQKSDISEEVDLKYNEIYLDKGEAAAQIFIADYVKQKRSDNRDAK